MENNKECKYPLDLGTYFNGKKKVLNVESFLYRAEAEKNESPYKNYNDFSRYKFTYLDKTGSAPVFVYANVKPMDIPDIKARTEFANNKIYELELASAVPSNNSDVPNSPAYTVRISSGKLKGKTPAEVLAEDEVNGKNLLNQQYQWLKDNLQKYPNNIHQMNAISEAGTLLAEGKLQKVESKTVAVPITILKPEMRPLTRQPQRYGKSFVYEIGIICNPGDIYPYRITIDNYYAPVNKRDDGTYNVLKSDAQDLVSKTFYMSVKDFNALIYAITTNMRQFENLIEKNQFNEAYQWDKINRENARGEAS